MFKLENAGKLRRSLQYWNFFETRLRRIFRINYFTDGSYVLGFAEYQVSQPSMSTKKTRNYSKYTKAIIYWNSSIASKTFIKNVQFSKLSARPYIAYLLLITYWKTVKSRWFWAYFTNNVLLSMMLI